MKKYLKIILSILAVLIISVSILLTKGYIHYKSEDFKSCHLYDCEIAPKDKNLVTWHNEICWGIKNIQLYNWDIQSDEYFIKNYDLDQQFIDWLTYDLNAAKYSKAILIEHILQLIGLY